MDENTKKSPQQMRRQRGSLKDLHVRIPTNLYEDVCDHCERLGITQAEYVSTFLQDESFKKLDLRARRIAREPIKYVVDMDRETLNFVNDLTKAYNENAMQLHRIGVNISNMIRDVRSGGVSAESMLPLLNKISREVTWATNESGKASEKLVSLLHSDTVSKTREIKNKRFQKLMDDYDDYYDEDYYDDDYEDDNESSD